MAISMNLESPDFAKYVMRAIESEMREEMYKEMYAIIAPRLKSLAAKAAKDIVNGAELNLAKDSMSGDIKVMVKYNNEPVITL